MRIINPQNVPTGHDAADLLALPQDERMAWLRANVGDFEPELTERPTDGTDAPINGADPAPVEISATVTAISEKQPEKITEKNTPNTTENRPAKQPAKLRVIHGNTVAEAEPMPAEYSDSHIADEWIQENGADWRYVVDWSSRENPIWMHWTDAGWVRDIKRGYWPLVEEMCIRVAQRGAEASLKRSLCGAGKYGSVSQVIMHRPDIACTSDGWDCEEMLLGIPGGYVNLETGEVCERDRTKLISMHTSVIPQPGPHPLADRVIEKASGGDPEKLAYLWRWFGYMLSGSTREERFLYLHGPGGSGKGTLIKMIADIMGDYACTIGMEALVQTKNPQHSQSIAKLQGKRFVYASEASGSAKIDEEKIKWLTGRDKITAHFMRQNDFEFYPAFKLLVYGNEIPQFSGSEGMQRRFDLVEYAGALTDEERDVTLKDRLRAEYPAVLHSMIEAARRWHSQGLGMPESVRRDSTDYIQSQDIISLWLEQRVKRTAGELTKSTDAYKNFISWRDFNGYRQTITQTLFTQRIKSKGWTTMKRGVKFFEDMELHAPEYGDEHSTPTERWD